MTIKKMVTVNCIAFSLLLIVPGLSMAEEAVGHAESTSIDRGLDLTANLSNITGVAISPLLGISAVGAIEYFQNQDSPNKKAWYGSPFFWVPGLFLVFIFFINDYIPILDKISSGIENLVDTAGPILLAPTFLPKLSSVVNTTIAPALTPPAIGETMNQASLVPWLSMLNVDPSTVLQVVSGVVAIVVFAAVWMAGHVINLLVLMSPLPILSTALRGFKYSLLGTIVVSSLIHPALGIFVSTVIIVVALLVFRWTFRLSVMGVITSFDFLMMPWMRRRPVPSSIVCFVDSGLDGVPNKTVGHLSVSDNGGLVYSYRPWLIFSKKSVDVIGQRFFVGKELFLPSLRLSVDGPGAPIVLFSCRYMNRESDLCSVLGIDEAREMGLRKKGGSVWAYLKSMISKKPVPTQ